MADNGSFRAKERLRASVARQLGPDDRVLDMYAGGGRLYEACWSRVRGAACDSNEVRAREAAITRPEWAVAMGDSVKLVAAGWLKAVPFRVVDIDSWGAPWSALHAWCASDRERAPVTTLFLTDGYRRVMQATKPLEIFWGSSDPRPMCAAEYERQMLALLAKWGAMARVDLRLDRQRHDASMWLYELAAKRLS